MEKNTTNSMNNNTNQNKIDGVNNKKKGLVVPLISIIISFMIITISLIAIFLMLKKANKNEKPKVEIEKAEDEENHGINGSEVDTFYERAQEGIDQSELNNNTDSSGETQEEFSVTENNTFSEEEVIKFLEEREFSGKIITDYDLEGNNVIEKEISSTSKEKHPSYTLTYTGEGENSKWTILIIGKEIIAKPTGYDETKYDSTAKNAVVEKESIVEYNSENKVFYKNMPSEDQLVLTKVEKIDKKTLDELSNTKFNYQLDILQ